MNTNQSNKLNRLLSAETDRDGFIYFSVNTGRCIFKVDRSYIKENITQHNEIIVLYQIHNIFQNHTIWVEVPYVWLHSICDVYTMDETISFPWGNDIKYKRYSLYQFVLLKILIRSYIAGLRHRVWHPDSALVANLKIKYLENQKLNILAKRRFEQIPLTR